MFKLLGKNVKNSYSKEIFEYLGYKYELCSVNELEFIEEIKKQNFNGLNITMPYKQLVIDYLDEISDVAKDLKVVNTVVRKGSKLIGYNTDFFGLKYLIESNNIDVLNKKVAILGTGATSNTAKAVLKDLKAKSIFTISRSSDKGDFTYDEVSKFLDTEVIINTTPAGMIDFDDKLLIDLNKLENLEAVVDVVYNPLNTNLVVQARQLNLKAVGGLKMLVAQAIKSLELFLDLDNKEEKIEEVYQYLKFKKQNIVLIGLPTAGKTTIGRKLSEKLNKEFFDIDYIIVENEGRTILEIFKNDGEDYFRMKEAAIIKQISDNNNSIISSGGGSILDIENINNFKKNGILIFIDRPLEMLYPDQSRPLSATDDNLVKLYNDRLPLYKKYADIVIVNDQEIDSAVNKIIEEIK